MFYILLLYIYSYIDL